MTDLLTLKDYQNLVAKLCAERGFDKDTELEAFLILAEEVGELAKAIRQQSRLNNGKHSDKKDLELELADVFWLTLALANKLGVDLTKAFEEKEKINTERFKNKTYKRASD